MVSPFLFVRASPFPVDAFRSGDPAERQAHRQSRVQRMLTGSGTSDSASLLSTHSPQSPTNSTAGCQRHAAWKFSDEAA